MRLTTAQSIGFDPVTAEQLHQAFSDDAGRGEFVILSQQRHVYIQAAGEGGGPYCLEYRDGDDEPHFRADGDWQKDDVQRAFLWYLAGDPRWRTEFPWRKVAPKPWWKFW